MCRTVQLAYAIFLSALCISSSWDSAAGTGEETLVHETYALEDASSRPIIRVNFTNVSKSPVHVFSGDLPWSRSIGGTQLLAVRENRLDEPFEKRLQPVNPVGWLTLRPGETISGEIEISAAFPTALEERKTRDILIFWTHEWTVYKEIEPTRIPTRDRLGGMLILPKNGNYVRSPISAKTAIEVARKFANEQGSIGPELSAETGSIQKGSELLRAARFRGPAHPKISEDGLYWEVTFTYSMANNRKLKSSVIIDAHSGSVVVPSND